MKKRHLRCLVIGTIFSCIQPLGFSQATKLTNFSYGAATSLGGLFQQGNYLYFINRASDPTIQEWSRLDLTNTNTSTNVTLMTNDHYRSSTGSTIFRTPYRFGDNVFIASAKPTTAQDIEFSRFNLAAGTEQWIDIFPGTSSGGTPNYSDPIVYSQDETTGRVYFNANTANSFQYYYWDPTSTNITQLTNVSGGSQQNSSANMVVYGDYIYTGGYSGGNQIMIRIHKTTGAVTSFNYYGARSFTVANNKIFFTAKLGTASDQGYNAFVYNPTNNSFTQLTNYTTETIADGNVSGFVLSPDKNTLAVNVTYYNTTPTQGSFFTINTNTNAVTYRSGPTLVDRNFYLWITNSSVYVQRFVGGSTTTRSVYKIDLASNNSTLLTGTTTYTTLGTAVNGLDGSIYLSGTDASYGSEVYSLNLLTDVFTRLTDISPNGGTAGNSNPTGFTVSNSKLYFFASSTGSVAASADYEIYSLPIGAILPLKWISFNATPTSLGNIQLDWKVAEVQGVKGFEVEVSADGRSWNTAGNVIANNATNYQYTDKGRAEKVVYYRVKEVSIDGSYSYSQVQKVALSGKGSSFALRNNPAKNNTIAIELSALSNKAPIVVLDASGRTIARQAWNGGAGIVQIKVPSAGIYIVKYDSQSVRAVVE